ncbi:MAG TPA: ABC transporter permease, partial [bacterium]|nr:ABC transporter permease [bacterium]
MFKNYLKIALRNLQRNKLYSYINIAGLAVGLSVCILILLYVQFEWSFDTFNTKSDRIYRAWINIITPDGQSDRSPITPLPLGEALRDNIPGVEATTRLYAFQDLVKTQSDAEVQPGQFMMADPAFFKIFDFKLLQGDKSTVFTRPNSIVLTPEMARRFFGKKDPLRQTLSIKLGEQYRDFSVTGIVETPPANSSIQYQMLMPFSNGRYMFPDLRHSWFPKIYSTTYVLFQKGVQPNQLTGKLDDLVRQELGDQYRKGSYLIGFQPLTDIHLDTRYGEVIASVTNPAYAYILAVIALLVLVIACINFITLSVSQSTSRAKEIGIRKTLGAERRNLIFQLWGEALLITVF